MLYRFVYGVDIVVFMTWESGSFAFDCVPVYMVHVMYISSLISLFQERCSSALVTTSSVHRDKSCYQTFS